MELWIRSQQNQLISFKDNFIRCEQNVFHQLEYEFTTDGTYSILNNDKWLGTYKTKERALEVLDEIQEKLEMFSPENYNDYEQNGTIVYRMPKE